MGTIEKKGNSSKKAQGLPIYVIVIIILGIIVLAVVLLYIFGVAGETTDISKGFFSIGGNVTSTANTTSKSIFGG